MDGPNEAAKAAPPAREHEKKKRTGKGTQTHAQRQRKRTGPIGKGNTTGERNQKQEHHREVLEPKVPWKV